MTIYATQGGGYAMWSSLSRAYYFVGDVPEGFKTGERVPSEWGLTMTNWDEDTCLDRLWSWAAKLQESADEITEVIKVWFDRPQHQRHELIDRRAAKEAQATWLRGIVEGKEV